MQYFLWCSSIVKEKQLSRPCRIVTKGMHNWKKSLCAALPYLPEGMSAAAGSAAQSFSFPPQAAAYSVGDICSRFLKTLLK